MEYLTQNQACIEFLRMKIDLGLYRCEESLRELQQMVEDEKNAELPNKFEA